MIVKLVLFVAITQLCAAIPAHKESASLRISGGQEASPHSLRSIVFIVTSPLNPARGKEIMGCGGSLVTTRHVLTAAHCILCDVYVRYVLAGAHNFNADEPSQQVLYSKKVIIHPDYDEDVPEHDLGIIKLKDPATINRYVRLAILAERYTSFYLDKSVKAYGWGRLADEPKPVDPEVLYQVTVKVIKNDECKRVLLANHNLTIYDTDICTYGPGRKGTRRGDSGGPILYGDIQIGVISRGPKRLLEGDPSIACSVGDHYTWIREIMASF